MRLIALGLVIAACGPAPAAPAESPTVVVPPAEAKPGPEPETATASRSEPERPAKKECKPVEGSLAKAKEHFVEGVQLYERGEYGAAIVAFRDAYEISCSPQILYNIARAHEQLGEVREAVEALERYLESVGPEMYDYEEAKRHLEQLKQKL